MADRSVNMTEGPLLGKMVTYTLPILASGILQLLYSLADSFVVGRFAEDSEVALAAIGSTGSISSLLVGLLMGLSVGGCVAVSQYIGARRSADVHETVHTAMAVSLLFGIPLGIIGFVFAEPLLLLMNTPQDVIAKSSLYMSIYFIGVPASMVYNFASAILRAKGDTRFPFYVLVVSGLLNVGLNLLFVIAFGMDVAGVGWATVASQVLSAVLCVVRMLRSNDDCRLVLRHLGIRKDKFLRILRIGLPAGIQSSIFAISNVLLQSSVNSLGTTVMAANTASSTLDGFVYISTNSVYHTTLTFVGQNIGAGRYDRVKKILWRSLLISTAIWFLVGGVELLFAEKILTAYMHGNMQGVEIALSRLVLLASTYFLCGYMEIFTGVMRGLGNSLVPMLITVIGVCGLRTAWVYFVFPIKYFHNLMWLFASYPITWAATLLAQVIACIVIMRRTRRQLEQTDVPLYVK